MVLNQPTGIKEGEPCEHEDHHVTVGVGETEDREQYVLVQCYECWDRWDVWREWELGGSVN